MAAQAPLQLTKQTRQQRKTQPVKQVEKFAPLKSSLLDRDEVPVITRPGAKIYSTEAANDAVQATDYPRVAVTFRMEKSEFVRLRKGAKMIGVQPRDVVHRAIKNCLDAYGVDGRKQKPAR